MKETYNGQHQMLKLHRIIFCHQTISSLLQSVSPRFWYPSKRNWRGSWGVLDT